MEIRFDNLILRFFLFFQLPVLSIIFLFFFLELIYLLKPNIFPQNLTIWIDKDPKSKEVIEYLDHNPYIKFKPNVKVESNIIEEAQINLNIIGKQTPRVSKIYNTSQNLKSRHSDFGR